MKALTDFISFNSPSLDYLEIEQWREGEVGCCISSNWNSKEREDIRLPGISNRFISRDGKNVIRKGGEDFESAVRIINFQRGLHAIWWQLCIFQVPPNILYFHHSLCEKQLFYFKVRQRGADEISTYHRACSRIPCYRAGCPGLKWICERKDN